MDSVYAERQQQIYLLLGNSDVIARVVESVQQKDATPSDTDGAT
jgi:hypothetical protein